MRQYKATTMSVGVEEKIAPNLFGTTKYAISNTIS